MRDYRLTDRQLRKGWERCVENVQNLLYSATLLLSNNRTHQFALGLYILSVEEFGKALLLKKCFIQSKQKKMHKVPKWIFGNKDPTLQQKAINNKSSDQSAHHRKLKEAFDNLPPSCEKLSTGIRITYPFDQKRTFYSTKQPFIKKIKPEDRDILLSVPYGVTGFFSDPRSRRRVIGFDLRTACFYIDWDKAYNRWKFMLAFDSHQLATNIKLFEETLRKSRFT